MSDATKSSEKHTDSSDNAAQPVKTSDTSGADILSVHTANAEVPLPATNAPKPSAPVVPQPPLPPSAASNPEEVVLFVSGFGHALNDESFAALFAQFGKVVSCKVLVDLGTGKSKGCGLIRMETKKSADAAIAALNNTTLPGQVTSLSVKVADTPEEKNRRRQRQLMNTRFNPMARPMPFPPTLPTTPVFPSVAVPPAAAASSAYPNYPIATPNPAGQWTLYVGGLPQGVDDGTLYKMFSPYGAVASVKVVMDVANPTVNKGYAFVNFFRYEEAVAAIYGLNNQAFGEKRLSVSFKTPPKQKPGAVAGMPGLAAVPARAPGAATGGYTGAAYPAGYTPAAAAPAAATYQSYPYGGSYQ